MGPVAKSIGGGGGGGCQLKAPGGAEVMYSAPGAESKKTQAGAGCRRSQQVAVWLGFVGWMRCDHADAGGGRWDTATSRRRVGDTTETKTKGRGTRRQQTAQGSKCTVHNEYTERHG